jgi:hypothetical protein
VQFVKIESLKVPAPKANTPYAKPPAVASKPFAAVKAAATSARPLAAGRGVRESVAGDERRRSQRVLLRVHANIHVAIHGKPVSLEATTLSVNDHGAVVCLKQTIPSTRALSSSTQARRKRLRAVSRVPHAKCPRAFTFRSSSIPPRLIFGA